MDAIGKIHEFEKFGSILGLERISRLMELLGNPQDELKYIHVAGTNGKGSCSKYLYSVLSDQGYKVGLYTSPFLEIFNERIEFNGEYITDSDLDIYTNRVLEKVKVMTEQGLESPTEFEVITAVAFLYFKEKAADIVVLEVGLGGIGDSTNIIKNPLCSLICSISYDHTDRLGTTLAEIAMNKAGIIKDKCPIVTSASSNEALEVISKEAKRHNSYYLETKDIKYEVKEETLEGTTFSCVIDGYDFDDITIGMLGKHQIENAILSLSALKVLMDRKDISLSIDAIKSGMKRAKQIGRFEIVNPVMKKNVKAMVILDGAHNPDGALALSRTAQKFLNDKKVLMLTGMLKDIVRGEWGYTGLISTDMMNNKYYFNAESMVMAGITQVADFATEDNHLNLGEGGVDATWAYLSENAVKNDAELVDQARENLKYQLYTFANSAVLNVQTMKVEVWWDTALKTLKTVSLVLFVLSAVAFAAVSVIPDKKKEN